jgi:hypothetical protein
MVMPDIGMTTMEYKDYKKMTKVLRANLGVKKVNLWQ